MGILKKFFGSKKKEEVESPEEKVVESPKINPNAVMHDNVIYCNACSGVIEGVPRHFNFNGRRMIFHKKCLKNLKRGNLKL